MTSVFYIHLIATLINAFFIVLLWWYNRKLIDTNYQLIKDNRDILVEAKKQQERMNEIETRRKNNLEAINKIDAIAKHFENDTSNAVYTCTADGRNCKER